MEPKERIIVALDVDSLAKATPYIEGLAPHVGYFKVGLELLMAVGATQVVQHVHRLGGHLFVDGKFNDIPNTVAGAARVISSLGVKMFNVHASAGIPAIRAAADNKGHSLLLAVAILTSLDDAASQHIFGASAAEKTKLFAKDALEAGADGIVCSAQELEWLSGDETLKDFKRVTPGIRPAWAEANDQKRTLTPAEAIKAGATHLVIGRPITNPPRGIGNPLDAIQRITEEIAGALA
jgi:orotidine-5'-phosphate decarboxylase